MMDKRKFDEVMKSMESLIVDEQKIVTYKCLIRNFNVNPNTAKQLLYSFATTCGRAHDNLSCAYQISGRKQDGSFFSTIINEKDLDDARNSFMDIFSETVYSVQPSKHLNDLQILYAVDKFQDTSTMNCEVITCTECIPQPVSNKPVVQAIKSKPEVVNKQETVKKKDDQKVEAKKPEMKKGKEDVKSEAKKPEMKKGKEDVKPEAKKPEMKKGKEDVKSEAKTSSLSSMFAAQNQKLKVAKTAEKPKEIPEKVDKRKNKRKAKTVEEEDSKEKRKRIRVFSSSEDEEQDTVEKERSPSPEPVHEPIVEIEEGEEEIPEVHKRKKRKIVDKTVMTEEGYIETIKEVVYQTDSDEEQPGPSKVIDKKSVEAKKSPKKVEEKKSPKKPVQKKSPVSPKRGKQKASNDGRKQQSLLSFFKKT